MMEEIWKKYLIGYKSIFIFGDNKYKGKKELFFNGQFINNKPVYILDLYITNFDEIHDTYRIYFEDNKWVLDRLIDNEYRREYGHYPYDDKYPFLIIYGKKLLKNYYQAVIKALEFLTYHEIKNERNEKMEIISSLLEPHLHQVLIDKILMKFRRIEIYPL